MQRPTLHIRRFPFTLLLRGALLLIALAGCFAFFLYARQSLTAERGELIAAAVSQTSVSAQVVRDHFDAVGEALNSLGDAAGTLPTRRALDRFRSQHDDIAALSVLAPDGRLLLSVGGPNAAGGLREDPAGLAQFMRDRDRRAPFVVSVNRYNPGAGAWVTPLRHTVTDAAGRPAYVVQADLLADSLVERWNNWRQAAGARAGLLRDDGYLLACWPDCDPGQAFRAPTRAPLLDALRQQRGLTGFIEGRSQSGHRQRLVAYARIPQLGLISFLSFPSTAVLDTWYARNVALIVLFAVSLCGLVALGFLLMRRERAHNDALLNLARQDALTGLPNRYAAEEYLRRRIASAGPARGAFAVLFIDLDQFKLVNDHYGHQQGDLILREIAALLQGAIRGNDFLARLGGDEFLAVIDCRQEEHARTAAIRLMEIGSRSLAAVDRTTSLSMSIGISMFPRDGGTADDLLKKADIALYSVKNANRNNFAFFKSNMNDKVSQTLLLRQQLEAAVRDNQFELYYQPKYNAQQQIVGVEALIRWNHPERGLVMPGEFIPVAEETGVIVVIGEWALAEACRQLARWREQGIRHLRMSVNVSAHQLELPTFTHTVADILVRTRVDPRQLEIEITESALANDIDGMRQRLLELESLGVGIALDDFGTCYSSLNYLKKFPIHSLKIDRSFVNDILSDSNDAELTNAIIAMGHALKIKVIAEGVETAEQLEYLKARRCDEFQGFYLARPQPVRLLEPLLADAPERLDPASPRGSVTRH